MNDKEMLKRDLDLFESINQGHEEHLKGSESLPSINPLTKAIDVAYVRFSVPDLNLYEDWIHDFGLKIIYKDKNVIYSRGLGGDGFCHVVHRGSAKFLGFALQLENENDLNNLYENNNKAGRPLLILDSKKPRILNELFNK